MSTQIIVMLGTLGTFALLGVALTLSIKKHEKKMATEKKKKGRNKYMPEYKRPGNK